ncbi:glycoside hydrolase family 65 protein [Desnuesiella massiliensis]|uniref:glycoside hydrolase family 65 protein n=1 Tax=Desnuesiella massiliensis TaxID=1650662 RepID=UPI0006E17371|nr:glycoside hydrolase family 65 protein [Desnuesiella massiliensis]
MKNYVNIDEWKIIEEGFHAEENEVYESFMSLGNGNMGMRGNFEEDFSGNTLKGTYIAGVYYPDKTRVGWWKNGYPEYFAKVLNAVNFIGIRVSINGENLDLAKVKINQFSRILNMRDGYLLRTFTIEDGEGRETKVEAKRFLSIANKEIGAISYSVTPQNYHGVIELSPYLDGDIKNKDSNYDEKFWDEISKNVSAYAGDLTMKTKKLDFYVTSAMKYEILVDGNKVDLTPELTEKEKFVGNKVVLEASKGHTVTLNKYISITSNRYYNNEELVSKAYEAVNAAYEAGFEALLKAHAEKWHHHWNESDIVIEGDVKAQQSIRFNIFQLNQTYTGEDERLNIGPKGFTGEKYGGSTYWDTEAYCIPFYLSTAEEVISKNLLIYRHKQLDKAIENAEKLGFTNGAALYPMVTMNGEECHNEWEITFEEIHRNGAIAHAIYNYVNYTGDIAHLGQYGFEVLVGISRFWAQRVNFSEAKGKYVMLGVTGPNEYDNNVNNNWYTNTIACWTMEYTLEVMDYLKNNEPKRYEELVKILNFNEEETVKWKDIIENMYFPVEEKLGIFLQQDGYMDKEQILVKDLDSKHLPLNQKWSWDRILRSCFIKQADVLQGIYFFEDRYDFDTIKRNFDFYEPRTVHESSLSPCVHSILAAKIGMQEKAYEMYLRTARLDLDNYNNDTEDGLHITSMAGTWMSIVHGFGGMRVRQGVLCFNPFIPDAWSKFSFKIMFRKNLLKVTVDKSNVVIELENGSELALKIHEKEYTVKPGSTIVVETM